MSHCGSLEGTSLHYDGVSNRVTDVLPPDSCAVPTLQGLRFVGGYYPSNPQGSLPMALEAGKFVMLPPDPLRLDISSGTFFGIEQKIFQQLSPRRGAWESTFAILQTEWQ